MIGIIPLLRPKTGIKTKLCNLKYTPKTAVAVVEKVIKIVFIPKVMTLPIDCMMIDGIPTEYICLTI